MYKRIICFALAILALCGMFTVSVSADASLESVFKEPFIEYVQQNGSSVDEETLYIQYIGSAGECGVYRAYHGEIRSLESKQVIGDYLFSYDSLVGDEESNPTGLYAWDPFGFGIITLKEAYDRHYADLDALYDSTGYKYGMSFLTTLEKEDYLKEECKKAYIREFDVDISKSPVLVEFAAEFNNYTVFRASHLAPAQMGAYQEIDGYWFYTTSILGDELYNPTGVYTLDNYGNVRNLSDVVLDGFFEMDYAYPALSEYCEVYMAGDIDNDKKLSVKDATLIQKYLAGFAEAIDKVDSHNLGFKVMDADLSGEYVTPVKNTVNIKDATYIQKKLAKIITDYEEEPEFSYYEIEVFMNSKEDGTKYTLEDFPEYRFESIEYFASTPGYSMESYILTLEHPGRENVIDAVNALEARDDIYSVSVLRMERSE